MRISSSIFTQNKNKKVNIILISIDRKKLESESKKLLHYKTQYNISNRIEVLHSNPNKSRHNSSAKIRKEDVSISIIIAYNAISFAIYLDPVK